MNFHFSQPQFRIVRSFAERVVPLASLVSLASSAFRPDGLAGTELE
jgi:hypothetical protein